MQWIKFSPYNLPPQGLKIICFRKGDLWVAMRFEYRKESYYLQIEYGGKNAIRTDTPDYWMRLDLPDDYTGFTKVQLDGDTTLLTLDELQLKNYEAHQELVSMYVVPVLLKKRVKIKKKSNGKKED